MSWSALRADRVLRDIEAACAAAVDPRELLAVVAETVDRAIPTDAACWSTFDPATTMVTSAVGRNVDEHGPAAARFFEVEYTTDTPGRYAAMLEAARTTEVVDIDAAVGPAAAPMRSHLSDMGIGQELRLLGIFNGSGWAGAGLMRQNGAPRFGVEEIEFAGRVAPVVADGVRRALVHRAGERFAVEPGPAVLFTDGEEISEATSAALHWLAALAETDRGHGRIPTVVRAVAARVAAGHTVAQRARTADGSWVVLRAASSSAGRAVITIEEAGPPQVTSVIAGALGLTTREVEVTSAVLAGQSTKEIAAGLHLSAYTVQDHLKSIFAKAEVSSRRELIADVFFGLYAPRLGSDVGPGGFFLDAPVAP